MSKILIVEDDCNISEMVSNYLTNEGFEVRAAFDGLEAIKCFEQEDFDLVLLDLMIPGLDGMKVMKAIRETSVTPIMIVSAKDSDADKAMGLGFGADDYITKPFSLVELSARIKANIRRATKYVQVVEKQENEVICIGDLEIDLQRYEIRKKGEVVKLTSKEFEILKLLATNRERVYTKAQIYSLVWNEEYYGDDNVINVHIRRLREKIEDDNANPIYIKTVWGIGYKMGEV